MCVHSQTCENKCPKLLVNFGKSVSRKGEGNSASVAGPFCCLNRFIECLKTLVVIETLQLCQERTVTEVLLEIIQLLIKKNY